MRNLIIGSVLFFLGIKYGLGYLGSEKFQEYGDRSKAPWTCRANIILGELDILLSRYAEAQPLFERVLDRCPETSVAETAEFRVAQCLEKNKRLGAARNAYEQYAEKYPNTERARIAQRAAQILRAP